LFLYLWEYFYYSFYLAQQLPFNNMVVHVQPNEKILLKLRKHWFVLLRSGAGVLFGGLLPPIILAWLSAIDVFPAMALAPPAAWTFVGSLWLLIVWMALAAIWTNYYLDAWIVTDKRIIYIEQVAFFSRKIVTVRMERVQDVTDEAHGVIETLLHFGTLRIQTAGPTGEFTVIEGIPRPDKVRNKILDQVDAYTERMNDIYDNSLSRHDKHSE